MKNLDCKLQELNNEELSKINGGWLEPLTLAIGLVLALGELAEQAGKAYKESYL